MDYYVYILESEVTGSFYIGQTQDIEGRLEKHNRGYVKSTKSKRPWKLVYTQTVESRSEAVKRERYLKSLHKRGALLKIIAQVVPKN